MFRRHDLSEDDFTFTWHFSGWVWGRNDWDQVCSWWRFVTGLHVHCHVRVSGTYWPCSDLLRIDLTACEGLNLWTVSCSIKNFMISFEKCWYSWFTFQQLHPDTDDSVSEPEEEEVLNWFDWYKQKNLCRWRTLLYFFLPGNVWWRGRGCWCQRWWRGGGEYGRRLVQHQPKKTSTSATTTSTLVA